MLMAAIDGADAGRFAANLKGCLVKLRIPRKGEGKSGGYRAIVAYHSGSRAFFLYGFGKNERANIGDGKRKHLMSTARFSLGSPKENSPGRSMKANSEG